MGYYHIKLSAKSKELCTIVTQWGKYEYQRLPMGLCNSPDIFQEKMSELFVGLDTVRVYIDKLLPHVTVEVDHADKLTQLFASFWNCEGLIGLDFLRYGHNPLTSDVIT